MSNIGKRAKNTKPTQKQPTTDLHEKHLYSVDDSIKFLLNKFPSFMNFLSAKDYGGSVYITVSDSLWYSFTTSQRKQVADRLLDVIYASGDVKKILYVQDESSRVVAKQHTEKRGIGLTPYPYMDLM